MEIQPMGNADYDAAVAGLRSEGRLPSTAELSKVVADGQGEGTIWHAVDFAVDLRQALRDAVVNNATALRVYADVVRVPVPKELHYVIGGDKPPCRLDIIARRLEVDGDHVQFVLKDNPSALTTVARLLVGGLTGQLSLGNAPGGPSEDFQPYGELLPSKYELPKGVSQAVQPVGKTRLGLDLLSQEGPLYQLLQGSYELAAGLTAQSEPDRSKLDLARSILQWLNRWATYPSAGLIPLFQAADSLLRVLPTPVEDDKAPMVYVVPGYPSSVYFRMADSQRQGARDYDLASKFQSMEKEIGKALGIIVDTWARRDEVDDGELDKRIKQTRERVEAALAAVKASGKEIENQAFRNRFTQRELESVQNEAFIKGAVKAAFQAAFAVVEIAIGIGTGVANPKAMDALFKNTKDQVGSISTYVNSKPIKALGVYISLLAWPISAFAGVWNMDPKARKRLVDSAGNIGSGLKAIYAGADRLMFLSKTLKIPDVRPGVAIPELDEVGELVSIVSDVMDPPASKAAWDAYLAESTAEFQKLTDDQEQPSTVRAAARNYRVGIEKLAIYGRLFSERQAILAQEVRELGSLLLSKASVKQKKNHLNSVRANLADEAVARKAVEAENSFRLREVGRTFYSTFWGFRSALFYESMRWEIPSFAIPTSISEVDGLWREMERAKIEIEKASSLPAMTTRLDVSDPGFLGDLKQNGSAVIGVDPGSDRFADFDLVRVEKLRMWLEGVTPHPQNGVKLGIDSGASFKNRSDGSEVSFNGQPAETSFYYDQDRKPTYEGRGFYITPTPFATWQLKVENKSELDLAGLTAVRIEFQGTAKKRR